MVLETAAQHMLLNPILAAAQHMLLNPILAAAQHMLAAAQYLHAP